MCIYQQINLASQGDFLSLINALSHLLLAKVLMILPLSKIHCAKYIIIALNR
jgi:hypothetical protein